MNVEKAKDKARSFEAKGQNDKAIQQYAAILEGLDNTAELEAELNLFNKLGDLYLKTNNVQAAVETYERATDHYEKAGFPNNAIALCNKILRNAPGRTNIYLKLAKLMVQRGFTAEAKSNLLEYAQRMQKSGQVEQAFRALKEFADLSPENEEIRLLLAEQLKAAARTDEAREQLAKLYAEVEATGDVRRSRATLNKLQAIDPAFDPEAAPKRAVASKSKKSSDLVFLDLDDDGSSDEEDDAPIAVEEPPAPPPAAKKPPATPIEVEEVEEVEEEPEAPEEQPVETVELEIERASAEYLAVQDDTGQVEGLDTMQTFEERTTDVPDEARQSLEIETTALDDSLATGERESGGAGEVAEVAADDEAIEVPELDLSAFEEPAAEEPAAPPARPTLEELEAAVADNLDDPGAHQALGEALIEQGERERGLEELDHALTAAEAKGEWNLAEAMADEIVRLDPGSVRHHQKRVEYAYRRNDKGRLVRAYLTLADSLFREGHIDRARAVYQRVIEHDPDNPNAKAALASVEPEEAPASAPTKTPVAAAHAGGGGRRGSDGAGGGDFVDLGALVLEEDGPAVKNTRMRIEEEEPTGDEERDFAEMLAAFKKGIEQNVDEEDWQAHYDLGIAFKEMGLLDEAIGEFQKALRSPEGRLRSAEALGNCFFEKGQYSVAATVLKRAVDSDPRGDDEKIGLLYLVGRAEEEQGRIQQALDYYQRVFAIDITFQDVSDRVKSLANAGS